MGRYLGRRRFIWSPELKKMVEVEARPPRPNNDNLRFESNFISPIDGKEIRSKDDLHDHNQRHNVECTSDGHFQDWKKEEIRREKFLNGNPDGKEERIEAIKQTIVELGE